MVGGCHNRKKLHFLSYFDPYPIDKTLNHFEKKYFLLKMYKKIPLNFLRFFKSFWLLKKLKILIKDDVILENTSCIY